MSASNSRALIHQAFARWLFDQHGLSANTVKQYVRLVLAAEEWFQQRSRGAKSVVFADGRDLQAFLFSRKASAVLRNQHRKALLRFGEFRVWRGFDEHNPALALARLPEEEPRIVTYQARAVKKLKEASSDKPMEQCFILLGLHEGLRFSSIHLLEWPRIDLHEGVIWFRAKGGKERALDLHPEVAEALRAWRVLCDDPRWVFPSPMPTRRGRPMSDRTLRERVKVIADEAGVDIWRPHGMRHTFAIRLLDMGEDIDTVRELLGHKSVATTQRYLRGRNIHAREAIRSLTYSETPS